MRSRVRCARAFRARAFSRSRRLSSISPRPRARGCRDEDQRADRQLEFTQVDLEMSFPRRESVFAVVEKFCAAAWAAAGITLPTPFPRITYDDAIRQYGSD